jgi:hypothetical protein
MSNIFEQATKQGLYFKATKGNLSVYDLWKLPEGVLQEIYNELLEQAEKQGRKRLFGKQSSIAKDLKLKIAIVEHIADARLADAEKRELAAENRAEQQEILEVIEEKKKDALRSESIEKLEKRYKKLGG